MRVYHFLNEEWGLQSIEKRRLKISRLIDLNDPFDFYAVDLSKKDLREALEKTIEEQSQFNGLLCFSRKWHSPLLWGHYADKHKGLCLGFDIPDEPSISVTYIKERIEAVDIGDFTEEDMQKWISSKYVDWKYEDEVRVTPKLNDVCPKTGFYFTDYSNELRLREVIVGCKSKITRTELGHVLGEEYKKITKFKARAAFKTFEIVKNKDPSLWK